MSRIVRVPWSRRRALAYRPELAWGVLDLFLRRALRVDRHLHSLVMGVDDQPGDADDAQAVLVAAAAAGQAAGSVVVGQRRGITRTVLQSGSPSRIRLPGGSGPAERPMYLESRSHSSTYRHLVRDAFHPKYWVGGGDFDANGEPLDEGEEGYIQAEVNFSLFFGLAVQLYESTLVSDQTPFDEFMRGDDQALDETEQFGLEIFLDEGRCVNCHDGPELTGASVRLRANQPDGNEQAVERMIMGDGDVALYDGGFYNIGVRPTHEDIGVGGEILGFPISFSRQLADDEVIDDFDFDPDEFEVPGEIEEGERVAVDGAFKAPSLRNVELTGPYFHNGGNATLRQVVDFYDRGGDRLDLDEADRDLTQIDGDDDCDTTGFEDQCSNLDPDIQELGLDEIVRVIDGREVTASEALVAFLLALTDERVRDASAPFDHPQLIVPNGHVGNQFVVVPGPDGEAQDQVRVIPATGAEGGEPIGPFLGLDPQQP